MPKNIVIMGPPRSGKSTLAQKIVNELKGYSMISGDNFSASYIKACRKFKFRTINLSIPRVQSYHYFTECMHYENSINYVFESSEYNEEIIDKYQNKFIVIFLGYSKLSEQKLFENIRKNDNKNDWTYIESDWKLDRYCRAFIKESKEKEKIAKSHNYWYIDTSYNRDKVLNDTVVKIKELLDKVDIYN